MGKNTLMRRCIRLYVERTGEEKWNSLSEKLVGNVGIIFTTVRALLPCIAAVPIGRLVIISSFMLWNIG